MSRVARLADPLHTLANRLRRAPAVHSGLLLVSAGGLGDTVLFAHVVDRFAALAEPDESVTVLLRADGAATAFCLPPEIEILTVDFGRLGSDLVYRLSTFRRLAARGFRRVVSTDHRRHPYLDEALMLAAHAPETWAMEARPWPKHGAALAANGRRLTRVEPAGPLHMDKLLRWAAFADRLSGGHRLPPTARFPAERLPPAEALAGPTVLVQPFSAVVAKQLAVERWRTVIEAVPPKYAVVMTGGPRDLDRQPAFRSLVDGTRVRFESRRFAEVVPLLRAVALVISADTALMHLAAAVGTPTLGLASAAYVGEIVPYAPEVAPPNLAVMHVPVDCAGCLGDCRKPLVDGMFDCVALLNTAAIVGEIRHRLGP